MDSVDKLIAGFKKFRSGRFQEQRATYETLVDEGQHPKVVIVACSDSRVDPSTLLQADVGELFTIRNVANLIPPYEREGDFHGTSAALEYAVKFLEVGHVIVLGHAHCGGIGSLFEQQPEDEANNYSITPWISLVRSAYLRVEATMPDASREAKARACEQSAVLVSLENLMTFPTIRQWVGDGRLRLHGWYFDIRSGILYIYNSNKQHFEPVE